jgi:hypothetical protein
MLELPLLAFNSLFRLSPTKRYGPVGNTRAVPSYSAGAFNLTEISYVYKLMMKDIAKRNKALSSYPPVAGCTGRNEVAIETYELYV